MLFMVIERFKNGDPRPVGDRFRRNGRMLPDGVAYLASWIDSPNSRCFQIMEASNRESLDPWIADWNDLVDFEIVPVQTSADFWAAVQP
jgi:hypothetical protein